MTTQPLKPQYFVSRQNGSMVPLIAMDELPSNITIRNVSRTLSPQDMVGMTCVGAAENRHLQYIVDVPETQNKTNSLLIDRSLLASRYATEADHDKDLHENGPGIAATFYQGPPKAYGIREQPPSTYVPPRPAGYYAISTPAATQQNAQPLPAWHDASKLNLRRAPGTKEYCSYWLRHGECDYAQQGCLYKHEMPLDPSTLLALGYRDIPKWYRDLYGLASLHSHETVNDGKKNKALNDKNWRRQDVENGGVPAISRYRSPPTAAPAKKTILSNNSMSAIAPLSPIDPAATLHAQQANATLVAINQHADERRRQQAALPASMKGLNLNGIISNPNPNPTNNERLTTISPAMTGSTTTPAAATPVSLTTPSTTPEPSDDDDLLGDGPVNLIPVVSLPPTINTRIHTRDSLRTAAPPTPIITTAPPHANSGSTRVPKKRAVRNRRRPATNSESGSVTGSVSVSTTTGRSRARRAESLGLVGEGQVTTHRGGRYDHDD